MPSTVRENELNGSILAFAADGIYPESQDVIASEFPASSLPEELQRISEVRTQVQREISSLSNNTATDVDGWVSQARQLHADIERSRETAREIVAQHESTVPLRSMVKDASAKVKLVQTELAFNEAVTGILEKVKDFSSRIDNGLKAVEEERIADAIKRVDYAESFLGKSDLSDYGGLSSILHESKTHLRKSIEELLLLQWTSEVRINKSEMTLFINDKPDQSRLPELIDSFSQLIMLESVNNSLQRDLMDSIIQPVVVPHVPGESCEVLVDNDGVHIGSTLPTSVPELLHRISAVFSYLQQKLPHSISRPLSEAIVPVISTTLCDSWFTPFIPLHLDELQGFEATLACINDFCKTIEGFGWHGQEALVSWVDQFPRLWLTRRRVDSLDQVRKILIHSKGVTKEVSRVEKQMVTNKDDVLLDSTVTDDWDADWGNENEEQPAEAVEEEDVSAWGLEDEAENAEKADEDDDEDAWGWGDDTEDIPAEKDEAPTGKPAQEKSSSARQPSSAKEITLTETYTVTDIPDAVIALIEQQISDSEALSNPNSSTKRIVSSKTGLVALPPLILAMFKAIASSFYSLKLNAGNIYLYNDSMYLAEQVRKFVTEKQMTRLSADVNGLERFGRLSYSKEMHTQRTIVTDLLDGSQGFIHCSEQPFLRECENAIDATVDRIRGVFMEWQPILSHSALLQAIGSLLSAVINKTIVDIEDLSDISEGESQQLVSFCNKLSKLEDMFMPEPQADGVSTAAVYVRNWLKFQYLIAILESSLADIRYMWTEGELSLEFSPDEVIDLIQALFAESDHRRKTISEIRRARG